MSSVNSPAIIKPRNVAGCQQPLTWAHLFDKPSGQVLSLSPFACSDTVALQAAGENHF